MNKRLFSATSVAFLALTALAQGATISEVGDAGSTVGTVQNIGSGVDVIQGSIGVTGDSDLYRVFFNFTGVLTIRVFDTTGNSWDPNLLVFNSAGNPIGGDDDGNGTGPSGWDSRLDINITPGFYYIGVGPNNSSGWDASDQFILGNDDGLSPSNPAGVLSYIVGGGQGPGSYDLTFSTNSAEGGDVPEPSTFALLGGALIAIGAARFRSRN